MFCEIKIFFHFKSFLLYLRIVVNVKCGTFEIIKIEILSHWDHGVNLNSAVSSKHSYSGHSEFNLSSKKDEVDPELIYAALSNSGIT